MSFRFLSVPGMLEAPKRAEKPFGNLKGQAVHTVSTAPTTMFATKTSFAKRNINSTPASTTSIVPSVNTATSISEYACHTIEENNRRRITEGD